LKRKKIESGKRIRSGKAPQMELSLMSLLKSCHKIMDLDKTQASSSKKELKEERTTLSNQNNSSIYVIK